MFGLGKKLMDNTIAAANKILANGNKIDSGKPITTVGDFMREILRERVGVRQAGNNGVLAVHNDNNALFNAIGGKKIANSEHAATLGRYGYSEVAAPTDWQLAKSLFYNRQGELQFGRAAGAAVGFGGGAIATLNLGYDMVT